MNSNLEKLKFPFRCISYYASDKSPLDGKHSYEFWMRSFLVRIVCDKAFGRGDVLEITNIEKTSAGILITANVIDEWEEEYPVLNFISGRLVYNKWVDFKYEATDGIQVIAPIEQVLSDSYSIGFIVLAYTSGKISCEDVITGNAFDVYINLIWE